MTILDNIDISHLLKARDVFERCRKDMVTERDKMGAAQAFEFCYELCWKMMKRVLEVQGLTAGSPKDAFRKAVHVELIDDPEIWFGFLDARNLTVHTYNEESLEKLVSSFDTFSREMNRLIDRLRNLE
jgi:nucleotidyltransferase substrate binding protein (TIGR01987 family)